MNNDFANGFGAALLALSLAALTYLVVKTRALASGQRQQALDQAARDEELRDTLKRLADETKARPSDPQPRARRDMHGNYD